MFEPVFFFTFSLSAISDSWLSSGWKYTTSFFLYLLLINLVTSGVTAYKVDVLKRTWDNTWISFPRHRNQLQTSIKFLFSLKVELMLLLAILNWLKSFIWYFLMLPISWIYRKMELLQHVNMKRINKFYWYVKSFHLTIYWQVFVLCFNPTIFHNL